MTEFYYFTVRYGRRFAEMYISFVNDGASLNRLAKVILIGKHDFCGRRYRRESIMDRCYWEQRKKHKSKRK